MTKGLICKSFVSLLVAIVASTAVPSQAQEPGDYKILQHWSIPCSGHGGFGEKVIVVSRRQADLVAAFRRWFAKTAPDKSKCISFFAFSSMRSFEAGEHPSHFSDAELDAIPIGLSYFNNPNTGYEGWSIAGGSEHHGGP